MPFEIKLSAGRRCRSGIKFRIEQQNFRDGEWNSLIFDPLYTYEECPPFYWRASNGWRLTSAAVPEVRQQEKLLFLWGDEADKDGDPLYVSSSSWRQIKEAVREFNKWAKDASLRLSLEEEFFNRRQDLA